MENLGALAALGVIGPGIGIGILAGLAARRDRSQPRRRRRDPRPRDHPRGVRRGPRRPRGRRRPARDLHQARRGLTLGAGDVHGHPRRRRGGLAPGRRAGGRGRPKFQINLFWVIVAAANFVVFFLIVQRIAFGGLQSRPSTTGAPGSSRGCRTRSRPAVTGNRPSRSGKPPCRRPDARPTRSSTAPRRSRRRPVSRTSRPPATRSPACASARRPRSRRRSQRAVAELRGEVTDLALAAAGRVVGESMTGDRQRRLVADFLADPASGGADG